MFFICEFSNILVIIIWFLNNFNFSYSNYNYKSIIFILLYFASANDWLKKFEINRDCVNRLSFLKKVENRSIYHDNE